MREAFTHKRVCTATITKVAFRKHRLARVYKRASNYNLIRFKMLDDDVLPPLDSMMFANLPMTSVPEVPEEVLKRKCKTCKRMLAERAHFDDDKKTCNECLKRHCNRMRLKRRKARQAASTSANKKQKT